MWGASIVGFGSMRYRYASGRELDWFITGFAPRKNDVTLYIMPGVDRYREQLKSLGKCKSATSCLYIRKLSDIDPSVLREIVEASVKAMRQMEKDGVAS
jgi:hypothetical protein